MLGLYEDHRKRQCIKNYSIIYTDNQQVDISSTVSRWKYYVLMKGGYLWYCVQMAVLCIDKGWISLILCPDGSIIRHKIR